MIKNDDLARVYEWLTCTDMTITEAARAMQVNPKSLETMLGVVKQKGVRASSQIATLLDKFGPLSTKQICTMLNFSRNHVVVNLNELIDLGEIEKIPCGRVPLYKIRG